MFYNESSYGNWTMGISLAFLFLYFIPSVVLMYHRRTITPLKERSIGLITISGLAGFIDLFICFSIRMFLSIASTPCLPFLWSQGLFIPIYGIPVVLMCYSLKCQYKMGEAITMLGKLKGLPDTAEERQKVLKLLRQIRWRKSGRFKLILFFSVLSPCIILVSCVYAINPSYWALGNYGCVAPNSLLLAYLFLGLAYIAASFFFWRQLKYIRDEFEIRSDLKLVLIIQVLCAAFFEALSYLPGVDAFINDKNLGIFAAESWVFVITVILSHYVLCVKPTLATYGILPCDIFSCCFASSLNYNRYHRKSSGQTATSSGSGGVDDDDIKFTDLLDDEEGLKLFTQHLIREFSAENIEFWQACKEYRALQPEVTSKEVYALRAKEIFQNFVVDGSPSQVNLPHQTRLQIESKMRISADATLITPDIFDAAADEVKFLMSKDSFSRFKRSDLWAAYKRIYVANRRQKHHDNITPSGTASSGGSNPGIFPPKKRFMSINLKSTMIGIMLGGGGGAGVTAAAAAAGGSGSGKDGVSTHSVQLSPVVSPRHDTISAATPPSISPGSERNKGW